MKNFRPDDIEGEVIEEIHNHGSIYDEMLWEASHSSADYIDPAAAVKAIMIHVNEQFDDYYRIMSEMKQEFHLDMVVLSNSTLVGNAEYTRTKVQSLGYRFNWAEMPNPNLVNYVGSRLKMIE